MFNTDSIRDLSQGVELAFHTKKSGDGFSLISGRVRQQDKVRCSSLSISNKIEYGALPSLSATRESTVLFPLYHQQDRVRCSSLSISNKMLSAEHKVSPLINALPLTRAAVVIHHVAWVDRTS
jgi:hypothetical protein